MAKEVFCMNELENRFYSRAEISEVTGIPASASQFARDVKKRLTDEGYAYEWKPRRGVQIRSHTVTPLMELKKLLVERLGLSTQIDALDFARYLQAIMFEPYFASMPYETKEAVFSDICGHNIDDGTLRNWTSKLYGSENAYREKKGALWHTYKDEFGVKRQEPADPNGEEYKAYCNARTSTLEAIKRDEDPHKAYGIMIACLYDDYGCYYWCPEITLNAIGDDMPEILRLLDEILIKPD